MQRHHTGSGRRPVIPTDWETHHASVADGTHTATVHIGPAGGTKAFDPASGQTKTTPATPVYTGPAALAPASAVGADRIQVVDDVVALRRYVVAIDRTAAGDVTAEHRVKVTACSDPGLVGRVLDISAISHDSNAFELVLHCTLQD